MPHSKIDISSKRVKVTPSVRGVLILLFCLNFVTVPLALLVYLAGYTHLLGFDVMQPFYMRQAILFMLVAFFLSVIEVVMQFRFHSSLLADLPNSLLFCTVAVTFFSGVQYFTKISPIYQAVSESLGFVGISPMTILAEITVGGTSAVAAVLAASFFSRYCRAREWVN